MACVCESEKRFAISKCQVYNRLEAFLRKHGSQSRSRPLGVDEFHLFLSECIVFLIIYSLTNFHNAHKSCIGIGISDKLM